MVFEPTSIAKSQRIFQGRELLKDPSSAVNLIDVATPNMAELRAMCTASLRLADEDSPFNVSPASLSPGSDVYKIIDIARVDLHHLLKTIPTIIVTLGRNGILLARNRLHHERLTVAKTSELWTESFSLEHFPPPRDLEPGSIVSVNGAGDSFLGRFLVDYIEILREELEATAAKLEKSSIQQGAPGSAEKASMPIQLEVEDTHKSYQRAMWRAQVVALDVLMSKESAWKDLESSKEI